MEKIPYVNHLRAVSTGAAIMYILDNPVPTATWLCVQHITVEDETTNFDQIRVGQGPNEFNVHWWEDQPAPAAGVLYEFEELFFVQELHRVIVRLDGTTAEDRLNVWIDGYTFEKVISGRPFKPRKMEG